MYIHDLNPILINFGFFEIRWYSLAYIFGILAGWWVAKKIIIFKIKNGTVVFDIRIFDDLISYIIVSIIIGGRLGYVIFYNYSYFFENPLDIFKIWQGGMSFHGALIGVVIGTYIFAKKLDLLVSDVRLVELFINNKSSGIFIERERLNESFLRRNKIMPVNLYKGEASRNAEKKIGLAENLDENPGLWEKTSILNSVELSDYSDLE